jgi:hypothetical protein
MLLSPKVGESSSYICTYMGNNNYLKWKKIDALTSKFKKSVDIKNIN